jgi:hypothetical protein
MARNKHRVPKKVTSVQAARTLRSTGKKIFTSPVVREIFAACLVRIAAGLVRNEATKGAPSGRAPAGVGAAGNLGSPNNLTIGQVTDTLIGHRTKNQRIKKSTKAPAGRTKVIKKKIKPDGRASAEARIH